MRSQFWVPAVLKRKRITKFDTCIGFMRLVGATFGAGLCMKHLALCTIGRFMERLGAILQ